MGEKNLIKLAKKGDDKKSEPVTKKPVEKKEIKKEVIKLSPAEERDMKAKQKVEELLKDVDLTPDKKEELIELDVEQPEQHEGVEWLEEQLSLLTEQNAAYKAEIELTKADYQKIFTENQRLKGGGVVSDDRTKETVINLFNEIQAHYFQSGFHPTTGQPNLILYPIAFMNRMIMFFPFLGQYKKF